MSQSGQRRCGSPAAISSRNIRLQPPQAKGINLNQSARQPPQGKPAKWFESLNLAMLRRGAITDLACPPLKFPIMIKRVVLPKFFCRLEAFKSQAAGHRYLFLI
jgi:hypothetical protein